MAEPKDSELQLEMLSDDMSQTESASTSNTQEVKDRVRLQIEMIIGYCRDESALSEDCCINRVPATLRHLHEEAYTPKIISIGPFHHYNERLQDMEWYKEMLFKKFIERAKSSLDDLICYVISLEPKVRSSYSEIIYLSVEVLVTLILVDAGFIIQLFIMFKDNIDELSRQQRLLDSIWKDLLLLENQLPFFVVEGLYNGALYDKRRDDEELPSFRRLTYIWLDSLNEHSLDPDDSPVEIKHFTDLVRLFYLRGEKPKRVPSREAGRHMLLYNASALQEKGIKLKAHNSKCILDWKFSGDALEIPQISVDIVTEILFRNMIALEFCHYPRATYITDYALLLDCLIDTDKDVDLLVEKKIVRNYLGDSNNVALLFNGLGGNFTRYDFNREYLHICERLNKYCQDDWHKTWATLRRDYCNTRWRTVASIAGILLLVLTIVQTVFSVLQVYK